MNVLFATHNKAKLEHYRKTLEKYNLNVLSLDDLAIYDEVKEVSLNTEQNAITKAKEYYKIAKIPTIAVDDGLILDEIPETLQPGPYVRRIDGVNAATDEELIEHYINLVNQYGNDGKLNGRWVKGIAIVKNENNVSSLQYNVEKIFVNKLSPKRHEGYPLDSITITPAFNKYTIDLTDEENEMLKEKNNIDLVNFLDQNFG